MLGFIAGDIVGSPYRLNNIFKEDFGLFDTFVQEYFSKANRDWTRVEHEAQITRNVVPSLGVMRWLLYSDRSLSDLVKEITDAVEGFSMKEYGPDRYALAFLPLGLAAKDEAELSALQETLKDAFDVLSDRKVGGESFKFGDEEYSQACLLSEAVFKVAAGMPKNEIQLWASGLFEGSLGASESEMMKGSVKAGDIHNSRELNYSFFKDSPKDNSLNRSFYAALYSFLYTDNFEKGLRKAVSLGGCSTTVAGIFGALGQIAYGAVPPTISAAAEQYPDSAMKRIIDNFENKYMVVQHYQDALASVEDEQKEATLAEANAEGKAYVQDRTFHEMSSHVFEVLQVDKDRCLYFVPEDCVTLRNYLLKEKGVDEKYVRLPQEKELLLKEYTDLSVGGKNGTYVHYALRPEVRKMYFSDGKLMSVSGTRDKAVRTDLDLRRRIRYCFNDLKARVERLNSDIYDEMGLGKGDMLVHFETAAFAEVGKDRICVYKGQNADGEDNLLGEVRIDDKTGLVRLVKANEGLENYEEGLFDVVPGELFVPMEAFAANSKDIAVIDRDSKSPEQRASMLEALVKSRQKEMRRLEKYYPIQPLQDVYQCVENNVYDVTTAKEARIEQERVDSLQGSPYDNSYRKTNLDLMNEDICSSEDPEISTKATFAHSIKR